MLANNHTGRIGSITAMALGMLVLLRLCFTGIMGIMPQDAYYFFYSQHPALSYYDHPPVIAYILWLFTAVLGKKVFVLKLAVTCLTLLSSLSFYFLAKCFLNSGKTWNAVALFLSTFMVTILSLVATPDPPLMLFWTLALLALHRAVFLGRKNYWLLAGLMMGLAFDSKYTALFLPAGLVLFLLLSKEHRKWLASPWPWLAIFVFAVSVLPVLIWNWQHGFASFRFQGAERAASMHEGSGISPANFLGVMGHQSVVLVPVLFFALIIFLFRRAAYYRLRITDISDTELFLLCFFVPLFVGFFLISPFYWVKLNWMMPAYITGIIWVSIYLSRKWVKVQVLLSLAIHLLLAAEVLFYPVVVKSDDTWEGWDQLAEQVKVLRQQYPGCFLFSADDYKTSAVLNFYLDEMVYSSNVVGEQALQFDYIGTDLRRLAGKNALFFDSQPGLELAAGNPYPEKFNRYFDSIRALPPIVIKKGNEVIRIFLVYECIDYHPPAPSGR